MAFATMTRRGPRKPGGRAHYTPSGSGKPATVAGPAPLPNTADILPGESGNGGNGGSLEDWIDDRLGAITPDVTVREASVTIDPKTLALIGGALLLIWLTTRK